ncbi:TldD/PmbA family protein [Fretibacter rubidus]|uniref:TldD/PmbA family protein n=1 Tax=Fretibacter rubidus TaxID=570162 RepID=UPI00352A3ABE
MNALSDIKADAPLDHRDLAPVLDRLLSKAMHYGAEHADVIATHGRSLSVAVRDKDLEDVDNSEGKDIGLRVIIGARQASVSSSDLSDASLDKLAERAVAMARLAPEDPYCGLADASLLEISPPDLGLFDAHVMSPEMLKDRALEMEATIASVDGVSQAEGCSASWSTSAIYFKTSHGFENGWRSSRHGTGGMAIAERDGHMERDYASEGTRWLEDLPSISSIGMDAATRAVARLGAKQLPSSAMPVIFERRVAGSLLSALINAISGTSIARGTSFLKDAINTPIFASDIEIIDDPLKRRGHASRPWDGEGVKVKRRALIDNGVLTTWLLNSGTAKQLGLKTTGHAMRGIGGPPGVGATNVYMQPGQLSPAVLMAEIETGLLVTDMFGPSLNPNTGDYSVGVSGIKIEGGARAHAVSEVTIAGNLRDMYKSLTPANDLVFDGSMVAPSLRIEGMTLAGE